MKFFDYLYYRTYFAYLKKNDSDPWIYATNLVALMQTFNLLAIYTLVQKIQNKQPINKIVFVIIALLLIGLNYYRYQKIKPYNKLCDLWINDDKGTRMKKGILIVLYIILSVLLPVLYSFFRQFLF
jgi:hypothetical protein